jgi:hypothetical protein
MGFYPFALFAHIVGVLTLFIGMGLEWVSLLRLRRAQTVAQVRESTSLTSVQATLIVGGAALLFVAGVYMTIARWGWQISWIQVALGAFFFQATLGAAIEIPRFQAISAAATAPQEPAGSLSEKLERKIADRILWHSVQAHGLTALGVIFLMTIRPDLIGSLTTLIVALALSVITAQLWRPRRKTTIQTGFVVREGAKQESGKSRRQ